MRRGVDVGKDLRSNIADDKEAQKVLFGQRARLEEGCKAIRQ